MTLEGDDRRVGEARLVIDELVDLVEGGHAIGPSTVDAVMAALDASRDPREIFEDVVWRHRGKKITPKTVNQKSYVDAIRTRTITFGIGPAGSGKTYLAMAHAVAALADREVLRLVLVLQRERRRQRPHALGVIVRVLRIGVDLALLLEPEAGSRAGRDPRLVEPAIRRIAANRGRQDRPPSRRGRGRPPAPACRDPGSPCPRPTWHRH